MQTLILPSLPLVRRERHIAALAKTSILAAVRRPYGTLAELIQALGVIDPVPNPAAELVAFSPRNQLDRHDEFFRVARTAADSDAIRFHALVEAMREVVNELAAGSRVTDLEEAMVIEAVQVAVENNLDDEEVENEHGVSRSPPHRG